ncbi:MAG: hypothetical protein COU22_00985 [Candidatus Komeilibacteria bacterium CG10_big_fil_rev_8_21_14_0_10_41_13]|uniref:Uncharacterized protein n=1 Tax=Candidatus Komeilibacteria bacterium CG10_big_fil_rev_8_21_14_0_10_41_13 TaxID=1974476 RepID=A0A2M6WCY6_9BACT|nr:MAG: hypothetical protein COU22_00985 [Candidatus Komeilibacteria bacterium CG10_big_fil_rev_8_21_14_0_10_41_13]
MEDKTLEQHFRAIQEALVQLDDKFTKRFDKHDERFDRQDVVLKSIFEIIEEYDTERKAIKSDIWDLKKAVAEIQIKLESAKL